MCLAGRVSLMAFINARKFFFRDSNEELNSLLSDHAISQPILILAQTPNASGYANDPNLILEFELGGVINGRVSTFAYSLSPTQFVKMHVR
jgi:hypothetical protein